MSNILNTIWVDEYNTPVCIKCKGHMCNMSYNIFDRNNLSDTNNQFWFICENCYFICGLKHNIGNSNQGGTEWKYIIPIWNDPDSDLIINYIDINDINGFYWVSELPQKYICTCGNTNCTPDYYLPLKFHYEVQQKVIKKNLN